MDDRELSPGLLERPRPTVFAALGLMLPLMHIPSPFSLTPSAVPVPETIAVAAEPKVETGIPVIFAAVSDPLGAGLVASMDAPYIRGKQKNNTRCLCLVIK